MIQRAPIHNSEDGFTIIEVLVAIFLLLLGVVGSVTMINTANAVTSNNKSREGATNLAKQIEEAARVVDYDTLNNAVTGSGVTQVVATLQGQPGLSDADTSNTTW